MRPVYSHALLFISCALHALALPNIVTRAGDSLAALLTSGRNGPPAQQIQQIDAAPTIQSTQFLQQPQIVPIQPRSATVNGTGGSLELQTQSNALQAHLIAMQNQAHRQLSQLNAAVANQLSTSAANSNGTAKYGNVLEVLSNVGKVIHQQILGANGQVQIITSPAGSSSQSPASAFTGDLANTKKNEYQAVDVNQPLNPSSPQLPQQQVAINSTNYKEQGEILRQEIIKRASQLQQVVAGSMEVLKNNGDLIVRRLLEQMNHRLDQAKQKAEKIINEPATSEVATKALFTINQGLNNLNNIISNIVGRLDLSSKEAIQSQLGGLLNNQQNQQLGQRSGNTPMNPIILDPNRLRQNLQQLGQQFSSAINAAQQQRQLQIQNQQRN